MKYKNPKQVLLNLLTDKVKRKSLMELKNRYKESNQEYSQLIEEGIEMYDNYIMNEQLNEVTNNMR